MAGGELFNKWLEATKELQETGFKIDYSQFEGATPESIRNFIAYASWNMLAIDDEMAEMRKEMSWKPWQHDEPYADMENIIKEGVDILHFVANILVAAGATDETLDKFYLEKMEKNRQRQLKGYKVKAIGVKCPRCDRAIDDIGQGVKRQELCAKCDTELDAYVKQQETIAG